MKLKVVGDICDFELILRTDHIVAIARRTDKDGAEDQESSRGHPATNEFPFDGVAVSSRSLELFQQVSHKHWGVE